MAKKGKVTMFGPESVHVKFSYLVKTAIICPCDENSRKKTTCVGRFAELKNFARIPLLQFLWYIKQLAQKVSAMQYLRRRHGRFD